MDLATSIVSPEAVLEHAKEWFSTTVLREGKETLLEDGQEEQSRKIVCSHWTEKNQTQRESPVIRGAFACFDTIYNFLAAAATAEKAFFSVYLRIRDSNRGTVATDYGHTLSIKSIDSEEQSFDNVAALIYHTRTMAEIIENDYAGRLCTVVVDASICGTPGSPRSPQDTKGFIQMTKVAIRALFEIARVDSNAQVVEIVPGTVFVAPEHTTSLAFITADWESKADRAVNLVHRVRHVSEDNATNIDALLASVDQIDIEKEQKNIVLLGNTGSGKSHSGNWILDSLGNVGSERFIESESGSMTSYVDFLPRGDDNEWRVWDTPGLNDSYGRDDKFVHDIEKSLFEAGSIHTVILCFARLERIDITLKQSIRLYSRIVGRDLPKRLLLFVNRQPRPITILQKKTLIHEIRVNCGVGIEMSHIFDMNQKLPDIAQTKKEAMSLTFKYCKLESIKVGGLANMIGTLREVKELKDESRREAAKQKLIEMSAMALRKILAGGNKAHPLKVQPSLGTSIIMTSGEVYEMKDGYERSVEYHLEMPQHIRKRFDRRVALFGKCLFLWNADVEKIVNVVRSMRLVYRMLPDERSEGRRRGVLHEVYKVHLKLWGIDDALLDDTKYQVKKLLGDEVQREVTYFSQGSSSLQQAEDSGK